MDFQDYQQQLEEVLLTVPGSIRASGNKFVAMRCQFCGDSKKDTHKKRLYVKVKYDYGELPWFYCHNCLISGVVTEDFINDVTDGNINNDVLYSHKEYMNEVKKRGIYGKVINNKKRKIVINLPFATKSNQMKIDYIQNRLGIKLNRESIFKYKIVFNIKDYIKSNNIKEYTRDKRVIDMIDEDYVGFLSTNNEYINFRCVNDRNDDYHKRYILYNVYNSLDNTKKLYTINNKLDVMKDYEIVLAEGVFDIIGIESNIYLCDNDRRVFCSINGSGYYSVIMYLLKLGLIHSDLHIYSDKDVKLEYYNRLKQKLKGRFFGDMYVYYNTKGKDYGVSIEDIKLKDYEI